MMSRSTRVREDMVIEAAKALARDVSDADRAAGSLMPPVPALRDVAGGRAGGLHGVAAKGRGIIAAAVRQLTHKAGWCGSAARSVHACTCLLAWLPRRLPGASLLQCSARGGGGEPQGIQRWGGH